MKTKLTKIICLILALALLSGCAAAPSSEPQQPSGALPEVGDAMYGFVVKQIVPMDALGATGILYEHEKSGATLLYLSSEDTNRSFDITFRTPALDDKGKPHVFEHITICGSQKYPDANMFFPVANQTYNTYMNAFTYHGMTSYPVASLSEEQLMTMMDYYLSGVFEPLLYTEPRLAQREAWRYELDDVDAELNIAGTVYSEMQGALTLSAQALNNNMKTLYAGSSTAYESGGIPKDVRTLTYDELVEFHDTYYHPSNALITLYGDIDIGRFLEYIDREYLAGFDKKDIEVDMGAIAPYTETKYAEYEAAVEQGAQTENASEIYYGFALNGADLADTMGMTILYSVIFQESSPVMKALRQALPNAQITGYIDFDSPSAPYFAFIAQGVDPKDRDAFVAAVDEGLKQLTMDGVSADALDSVLAINKLSLLTTQEDTDMGVNASLAISLGWTYFGSVNYYPAYEQAIDDMTKESADALLQKYLTDNPHRAVSVTKPTAGLTEQNAQALRAELDEKKAAMTAEEIETLAQSSKEFIEWGNTPVSDEIVSKVVNMDVADLPEELRHYDVKDETKDGVRYMSAEADVSGVFSGKLMLEGSTIPVDKLQDVQACLRLMGELDTIAHSKEELSTLITRYLSGFTSVLGVNMGYQGIAHEAAQFSWIGLAEDAEASMALLSEILFDTDYSDVDTIKSLFTRWSSDFSNSLNNDPLQLQVYRCMAMFSDAYAYRAHVNEYDMTAHLQELIALAQSDPAAVTERMNAARTLVLNRAGATVQLAGSEDAISAYGAGIDAILAKMTDEEREKVDYSALRIPKRNEGIVVNSTVQMNLLCSDYSAYSGQDEVIAMLINDVYMSPQLRNALGAYGAYAGLSKVYSILYTYRDPNLAGTYEIFAGLPEYLKTAELTQQDVDGYIIGSYSYISRPVGLLSGALQAMQDRLDGASEELRLKWMAEAKAVTPETVVATAKLWEDLNQTGVRSTSGTESTLLASSELFDVLIYPDGTVKELTATLEPAA